jgi:hypothetical protein
MRYLNSEQKGKFNMIEPLTDRQKSLIVNNVVKACSNINALNKTGYKFIYLANGFIAHYNLGGFVDYYKYHDLKSDILVNAQSNQWDNFSPSDQNYQYYMSKKDVYNRIIRKLTNKELNLWNS